MKISKQRLRRVIRESYTRILAEGNASVDYMRGYEDAMDELPQNPTDGKGGYYDMGYADYLSGKDEEYNQLVKDEEGYESGVDWISWGNEKGLNPEYDNQGQLHYYVPYSGLGDSYTKDAERLGASVEDSYDGQSYIIYTGVYE